MKTTIKRSELSEKNKEIFDKIKKAFEVDKVKAQKFLDAFEKNIAKETKPAPKKATPKKKVVAKKATPKKATPKKATPKKATLKGKKQRVNYHAEVRKIMAEFNVKRKDALRIYKTKKKNSRGEKESITALIARFKKEFGAIKPHFSRDLKKDSEIKAKTSVKRKSPTYGKKGGAKKPFYYEYRMNRRDNSSSPAYLEEGGELVDISTFGKFYDYLYDNYDGDWDNVNSEDIIRMYIDDMRNKDVDVDHIEKALDSNPSSTELYEIWLGNSMNTPRPIENELELLDALGIDEDELQSDANIQFAKGGEVEFAKGGTVKNHLDKADSHLREVGTKLYENKNPKELKFRQAKNKFDDSVDDLFTRRELTELGYAKGGEIEFAKGGYVIFADIEGEGTADVEFFDSKEEAEKRKKEFEGGKIKEVDTALGMIPVKEIKSFYIEKEKFAKGGKVAYDYIPQEDIKELKAIVKGEHKTYKTKDILDGAYVKATGTKVAAMNTASAEKVLELILAYGRFHEEDKKEFDMVAKYIKLSDIKYFQKYLTNDMIVAFYCGVRASFDFKGDYEMSALSGIFRLGEDYIQDFIDKGKEACKDKEFELGLKYPDYDFEKLLGKPKETKIIKGKKNPDFYQYTYKVWIWDSCVAGKTVGAQRFKNGKKDGEYSDYTYGKGNASVELKMGYLGFVASDSKMLDVLLIYMQNDANGYVKDVEAIYNGLGGVTPEALKAAKIKFAKGGLLSRNKRYTLELAGLTGLREKAVEEFISENQLKEEEVLNIIVGLGRQQIKSSLVLSAYFDGTKSKSNKELLKFAKSEKAMRLAKGGEIEFEHGGEMHGTDCGCVNCIEIPIEELVFIETEDKEKFLTGGEIIGTLGGAFVGYKVAKSVE